MVPTAAQLWMKPPPPLLSKVLLSCYPQFPLYLTLYKGLKSRDCCQLPVSQSLIWSVLPPHYSIDSQHHVLAGKQLCEEWE